MYPRNWIPRINGILRRLHRRPSAGGLSISNLVNLILDDARATLVSQTLSSEAVEIAPNAPRHYRSDRRRSNTYSKVLKRTTSREKRNDECCTENIRLLTIIPGGATAGVPPGTVCSLCSAANSTICCQDCRRFGLRYYCSNECKEWDGDNHFCIHNRHFR